MQQGSQQGAYGFRLALCCCCVRCYPVCSNTIVGQIGSKSSGERQQARGRLPATSANGSRVVVQRVPQQRCAPFGMEKCQPQTRIHRALALAAYGGASRLCLATVKHDMLAGHDIFISAPTAATSATHRCSSFRRSTAVQLFLEQQQATFCRDSPSATGCAVSSTACQHLCVFVVLLL